MSMLSSRPLAVLVLSVVVPAQAKAPADIFPARSYGFVEFAGLDRCREASRKLGLLQIAKAALERGGKELAEQAAGMRDSEALDFVRERIRRLGVDPEALHGVLQGRMALGFGRPVFFGDVPMPSIALVIDVAGREAPADKLIDLVTSRMREGAGTAPETVDVLGTSTLVLRPMRRGGDVALARLGTLQVVTNSIPFLSECIAVQRGKAPALASERGCAEQRARLGADAVLSAYVSFAPLADLVSWLAPYEASSLAHALGMSSCDSLFLGFAAKGIAGLDVLHVGGTCPADGLLRKVFVGQGPSRAAAWCSDETGLFASFAVDTKALADGLEKVVAALPFRARQLLARSGPRGDELRDVRALAEGIGPEVALVVTLPLKKSVIPDVVLLAQVADGERLTRMVLERTGSAAIPWKETEYQGTKIHYVNVKAGPVALSPAFACKDGWLVATQNVLALKGLLARGMRPGNAIASAFAAEAGQSAVPFRMLARLNAAAQTYYDLAVASLPPEAGVDPLMLPTKEELAALVADATAEVAIGAGGITFSSTRPGSFGELVAGIGALLDWVLDGGKRRRVY